MFNYILTIMMQKTLLTLAACAASLLPMNAQQYEVSGKAPAGANVVYLMNMQNEASDSVVVKNGTFEFKGDAQGKPFALVASNGQPPIYVMLDGKAQVDMTTRKVSGTAENEALSIWQAKFIEPQKRIQKVVEEYTGYKQQGKEVPADVEKRINSTYDAEMAAINKLVAACCEQNRQSKFPAIFLVQSVQSMDKQTVIKLAEEGNPAYMQVDLTKRLKSSIEGWKRQMPGTMFTDLTLNDTQGKARKLSEFVGKGKYVLIDFWASWCGPCRREMPNVKALYEKYKNKGFDIVGLSLDNDSKAWKTAIEKMGINWNHLSDLKGWQSTAARTYGVNSIPAMLLVGPDGKIVGGGMSTEELDKKLGELLK